MNSQRILNATTRSQSPSQFVTFPSRRCTTRKPFEICHPSRCEALIVWERLYFRMLGNVFFAPTHIYAKPAISLDPIFVNDNVFGDKERNLTKRLRSSPHVEFPWVKLARLRGLNEVKALFFDFEISNRLRSFACCMLSLMTLDIVI